MGSFKDSITNLHEMVKTHLGFVEPDVSVHDGQPIEDPGFEAIIIGMTAEDLATDQTIQVTGMQANEENYDINCLIRVWSGDTDLVVLRERADYLYSVVKEQVDSDKTLKGATTWARIASMQYSPMRMPEQTVVNMTFRVRCRTLTR